MELADSASHGEALGNDILAALKRILQRCEEASVRLAYPGEGGERAFRGWLVGDLLGAVLGWPIERIVVGERFDLLLQDADGFPVATIETKAPYHNASEKERADFERRLSGYGSLRYAYFTSGNQWERLDIFSPTGVLEIQSRTPFDLTRSSAEEAEAFFSPLAAYRISSCRPQIGQASRLQGQSAHPASAGRRFTPNHPGVCFLAGGDLLRFSRIESGAAGGTDCA